jgi:pyruvate formate lyase activating enzyme
VKHSNYNGFNIHPAAFQESTGCNSVSSEIRSVRCILCPHGCVVGDGKSGICRTRVNLDGVLYTTAFGNPCSISVDPIEKKPLFHFFPGTEILSLATAGCNLKCLNCQNWNISQISPSETDNHRLPPDAVVEEALKRSVPAIAFTYTEPTVFYEYMLSIAKLAKAQGVKTAMISNGYINDKPLRELCNYLDAANIDLKCFDDDIYHKLTGGRLDPVLNSLKTLKECGVWLEITTLLLPGITDSSQMIEKMCRWLVENGFSDTPIHFSRFFPTFKLKDLPPTPESTLKEAAQIASSAGLKYVYVGNNPSLNGESTICPACGRVVIERNGYRVIQNNILNGSCSSCKEKIAGVWE